MRITCPWCGERDHQEFTYRGDAAAKRPAMSDESIEAHQAYVYDRENPDGAHRELWNHTGGCRKHLVVTRNTLTHQITLCEPIGPWAKRLKAAAK